MKESFSEKELIQFGYYLLSQERKKRFSSSTREASKTKASPFPGTRSRLALVHDADVANFKDYIAENPEIEFTKSSECILKK